jgi:hypothetical protein
MKTLSKAGWITLLIGIILLGGAYWQSGGMENSTAAISTLLGHLFYGGILWFGLFCVLMAFLFLNN